jgi:hypothetical protein
LGGWVGFGGGTGKGEEKGGVKQDEDHITVTPTVPEPGISGGGDIGLRLFRYFGIQTGIAGITDYAPYTPPGVEELYSKVSITQIPVLARVNGLFGMGNDHYVFVAGFGGIGMNVTVSAGAGSADPGMSFIAGGELGGGNQYLDIYFKYQYIGSLSGGSLTVDGRSYDYSMKNHTLSFGARVFLPPFRK